MILHSEVCVASSGEAFGCAAASGTQKGETLHICTWESLVYKRSLNPGSGRVYKARVDTKKRAQSGIRRNLGSEAPPEPSRPQRKLKSSFVGGRPWERGFRKGNVLVRRNAARKPHRRKPGKSWSGLGPWGHWSSRQTGAVLVGDESCREVTVGGGAVRWEVVAACVGSSIPCYRALGWALLVYYL